MRIGTAAYKYRLVVSRDPATPGDALVASETLHCDDGFIVEFTSGDLRVYRDGKSEAILGARPTRSGVGALAARQGDALARFQEWAATQLWLLRPDPRAMSGRVDRRRVGKAPWLEPNLANFAAWYLPTFTSKPGSMFQATKAIAAAMPGFVELFDDDGELAARFEREGITSAFSFEELSEASGP